MCIDDDGARDEGGCTHCDVVSGRKVRRHAVLTSVSSRILVDASRAAYLRQRGELTSMLSCTQCLHVPQHVIYLACGICMP